MKKTNVWERRSRVSEVKDFIRQIEYEAFIDSIDAETNEYLNKYGDIEPLEI